MVASFTTIYLPTLATASTLVAALTVYFARHDRQEEVLERWLDGFREAQERVAECVIDLVDAARREPQRMHLGRAKLSAAVAGLPNAGISLPNCRALVKANTPDVLEHGDDALREVEESLCQLASVSARRRVRLTRGLGRRWRIRRAFRKANLGDPYG